jgi:hypothetical protein
VRLQKDIFKNSQVGVYYTGIRVSGLDNQNVALDYSFNFKDFYYLRGLSAFTFNRGAGKGRNGIHLVQFQREPDAGLQLTSSFQRIEEKVDIKTGFINQVDIQSFELMAGYAWRLNRGQLRRFSFDLTGDVRQDSHGRLTGNSADFMIWTEFLSHLSLHGSYGTGRSRYQVVDPKGDLTWTDEFIKTSGGHVDFDWERGGFLKEVGLGGRWEKRGIYDEDFTSVLPGSQASVETSLVLRPWSSLEWSVEGEWIRQTIDATGERMFDGLTYETALHLQVTRSLFLNARLLGETRENQYNLDFLVGYYFGAGNIVQLSFKKSERMELLSRENGYSVTLKVSYLLRI